MKRKEVLEALGIDPKTCIMAQGKKFRRNSMRRKARGAKKAITAAIADSACKLFRIPPDPEDMNDRRAEAAGCALDSFSADMGELIDGKQQYTETNGEQCDLTIQNLTDLIADFGHFCDRNNIDFADILRRAQYHYDEETDNKGKQQFTAN